MGYVNSEPGNGSCDDGLSPAQTLGVIKVVEAKVQESENRVVLAIDALGRRLDERMDQRFDQMDQRFDQMDQRMDRMDQRMDRLDDRFERMDQRLGTLATGLAFVKGMTGLNIAVFLGLVGLFIWLAERLPPAV